MIPVYSFVTNPASMCVLAQIVCPHEDRSHVLTHMWYMHARVHTCVCVHIYYAYIHVHAHVLYMLCMCTCRSRTCIYVCVCVEMI